MTPARLARLLSAQSVQAKKVFAVLSVNEALSIQQIRAVLVARGSHLAHNAIEGCLHSLNRVGLVSITPGGFRAAFDATQPFVTTPESDKVSASMNSTLEITIHQSAAVTITAPNDDTQTPNGIMAATDRIAAIAAEVVETVEGVRQQLNKLNRLGSELDDLAIQITLETDQVHDKIQKLGQIQALMRELGVAA